MYPSIQEIIDVTRPFTAVKPYRFDDLATRIDGPTFRASKFAWLILNFTKTMCDLSSRTKDEKKDIEMAIQRLIQLATQTLWTAPIQKIELSDQQGLTPYSVLLNYLFIHSECDIDIFNGFAPDLNQQMTTDWCLQNHANEGTVIMNVTFALGMNPTNVGLITLLGFMMNHITHEALLIDLKNFSAAGNTSFRLLAIAFSKNSKNTELFKIVEHLVQTLPPEALSTEVTGGLEPGDTVLRLLASTLSNNPTCVRLQTLLLTAVEKSIPGALGKAVRGGGINNGNTPIYELSAALARVPQDPRLIHLVNIARKKTLPKSLETRLEAGAAINTKTAFKNLIVALYLNPKDATLLEMATDVVETASNEVFSMHDVYSATTGARTYPHELMLLTLALGKNSQCSHLYHLVDVAFTKTPLKMWTLEVFPDASQKKTTAFNELITIATKNPKNIAIIQLTSSVIQRMLPETLRVGIVQDTGNTLSVAALSMRSIFLRNNANPSLAIEILLKIKMNPTTQEEDDLFMQQVINGLTSDNIASILTLLVSAKEDNDQKTTEVKFDLIRFLAQRVSITAWGEKITQPKNSSNKEQSTSSSLLFVFIEALELALKNNNTKKAQLFWSILTNVIDQSCTETAAIWDVLDATRPGPVYTLIRLAAHYPNHLAWNRLTYLIQIAPQRALTKDIAPLVATPSSTNTLKAITTAYRLRVPESKIASKTKARPQPTSTSLPVETKKKLSTEELAVLLTQMDVTKEDHIQAVLDVFDEIDPSSWGENCPSVFTDQPELTLLFSFIERLRDDREAPDAKPPIHPLFYTLFLKVNKTLRPEIWASSILISKSQNQWTLLSLLLDVLVYHRVIDRQLCTIVHAVLQTCSKEAWFNGLYYHGEMIDHPLRLLMTAMYQNPLNPELLQTVESIITKVPVSLWHRGGVGEYAEMTPLVLACKLRDENKSAGRYATIKGVVSKIESHIAKESAKEARSTATPHSAQPSILFKAPTQETSAPTPAPQRKRMH